MNTPKNFALQLGALVSLYASIASLTTLLFGVITVALPDAADSYYTTESAANSIRFAIATLVVVFPVYLVLTRTVNQIRRHEEGNYLGLTKWLIYLSLLVGGVILVGDVIAVINGFLNGELTIRFVVKAAVLALVIATAFFYYLKDAQGYWQQHERRSLQFGAGALVVVLVALVLGFMHSETPQEVREAKIDDNQVLDLQNIQWRVEDYYRLHESLPPSLDEAFADLEVPVAPEDRPAYQYTVTGTSTYQLCATFAQDSPESDYARPMPISEKNNDWNHKTGEWCFDRVVERKSTEIID